MVIAKSHSFTAKLPKRRSCFLADKIWTHPVPHHDNNMAVRPKRFGRQSATRPKSTDDPQAKEDDAQHSRIIEQRATVSSPTFQINASKNRGGLETAALWVGQARRKT